MISAEIRSSAGERVAPNLKIIKDRVPQIAKSLRALSENRVMVGIPSDKASRKDEEDSGPINNAVLMAIHENGAPEVNLPARPVVHPTVKAEQSSIATYLRHAGGKAMDGDTSGMLKTMNALGIFMQNKLRAKITDGPFAPLSERTLQERRARGRTGTKPLIDTGQLRRALTYVIRKIKWSGKILGGK